jgi:hypothetical protein
MADDPYTSSARLCDDDGIVRRGLMHHGTDYTCTGHAHFAGEHYRCESPAHAGNLPGPLLDLLHDPSVKLPGEDELQRLLAERRKEPHG